MLAGCALAQGPSGTQGEAGPGTSGINPRTYTVSTLPAMSSVGRMVIVTDGVSSNDCSTGGGSQNSWCRWNGLIWTSAGGVGLAPSFNTLSIGSTGTVGALSLFATDGVTYDQFCYGCANGIALPLGNTVGTFNMAASGTYYIGWPGAFMSGTAATHRVYIPRSGTLQSTYGLCIASNTPSSANHSLYIRQNNTSDTTITTSFNWNGTALASWSATGLGITVSAGDYIELKIVTNSSWTTPTTNPTCEGTVFVQ